MYVYVCLHRIQPVPSTKISSFRVARRGTRETARRGANASFEPSTPATETDRERESFSQLWHPKRSRNVACPRKSGRLIGRNVGSFGLSFRANRILPPKRRRETRTARRRDSNLSPGRRVSDRVTRISVNGGEKRVAAMPRTRIFAYEDRSATRWPVERGAWPAGLNRVLEGLRSRARRGESVTHEGGTKEPGVPTKALAGCPGFRQTTSSPLCGHPLLRFTPSPPPSPPLGTVSQRDYAWPRSFPSIRFRSPFLANSVDRRAEISQRFPAFVAIARKSTRIHPNLRHDLLFPRYVRSIKVARNRPCVRSDRVAPTYLGNESLSLSLSLRLSACSYRSPRPLNLSLPIFFSSLLASPHALRRLFLLLSFPVLSSIDRLIAFGPTNELTRSSVILSSFLFSFFPLRFSLPFDPSRYLLARSLLVAFD